MPIIYALYFNISNVILMFCPCAVVKLDYNIVAVLGICARKKRKTGISPIKNALIAFQ